MTKLPDHIKLSVLRTNNPWTTDLTPRCLTSATLHPNNLLDSMFHRGWAMKSSIILAQSEVLRSVIACLPKLLRVKRPPQVARVGPLETAFKTGRASASRPFL